MFVCAAVTARGRITPLLKMKMKVRESVETSSKLQELLCSSAAQSKTSFSIHRFQMCYSMVARLSLRSGSVLN